MKRFFTYYFTRLYAVAFCLLASVGLWGQSMANYTFTSNTTSSLEDLSSGATSLLAGNNDDVGTVNTAIGFTFYYMGTAYTYFSANSNGQLRLYTSNSGIIGGTAVSAYALNTVTLAPMAGDNEVIRWVVYGL